jgi:hypothetical protein
MVGITLALAMSLALAAPAKNQTGPLAGALKRVGAIFPSDLWTVEQYPWEPSMLLAAADLIGARPRAEKATEAWRDGQVLFVSSTAPPDRKVGIGAVRLANAAAARSYFGLQIDLKRLVDEKLNQPVKSNKSQSLTFRGGEEALRIDRELIVGPDQSTTVKETTFLVRSGDLVVEFLWAQLPADQGWAEAVFAILRRAR